MRAESRRVARELPLPEALHSYLEAIRGLSRAATVSVYVPAGLGGSDRAILAHCGDPTPVPELADLESAITFTGRMTAPDHPSTTPAVFPSALERGVLVPLPSPDVAWTLSPSSERRGSSLTRPGRRRTDSAVARPARSSGAWLGLRFDTQRAPGFLERLASDPLDPELAGEEGSTRVWNAVFVLGGAIAAQTAQVSALLTDPATGLVTRPALEVALAEELVRSRDTGRSLSVLFVNPDGFASVNERVGREAGDDIVREIVARLQSVVRKSDLVARYGGVVCAVLLRETSLAVGKSVADKILEALATPAFFAESIALDFSIGVAACDAADEGVVQSADLLRRADEALNAAKRAGGGRVAVWEPGWQKEGLGHRDRLMGIFTGNMSRDYRNMALLWDAVNVMATTDVFESLAARVTERLYSAFLPVRVAVFDRSDTGEPKLLKGLAARPGESPANRPMEMQDLNEAKRAALERAFAQQGTVAEIFPTPESGNDARTATFAHFVPLVARQQHLGCLYLEESHPLDSSDVLFLQALAAQLALTLDRSRLASEDRRRLEEDRRRLRAEVDQLEEALQRAKLEYRSAEMEAVVATARRVAPTDATVLIMGESGTGKELLARAIHELSPRRNKPLIVVDCGSIAASLADSELFGHERGAYTGAQQRKIGRLAEGDGATVLLDEIGELPLEIQSKLLRFVQEKQITTVGGTHPRKVDVRIIAATNRDLAEEVAAGRFREDLYHRLNVVRLVVPPLRERPEDILFLAQLFLEKFSALHHKSVRRLSPESEALLLRHDWSGNVRELENRVMQAVILTEHEEVGAAMLGFSTLQEAPPVSNATWSNVDGDDPESDLVPREAGGEASLRPSGEAVLERLRDALGDAVESALAGGVPLAMPLGRWLTNDLVMEADAASSGVSRRAAQRTGIPETTFRRLLEKASQQATAGLTLRPTSWSRVRSALRSLVRIDGEGRDLIQLVRGLLLTEILVRARGDERTGSALFGVSLPTFRLCVSEVQTAARTGSK